MVGEMKRVAVIGSGVAGLASIKACLEEGLEPVCFEKWDDLGGTWYYKRSFSDDFMQERPRTYATLDANTSKDMMNFSDFPFPKTDDESSFATGDKVLEYLVQYAQHFGLEKYIEYKTEVVEVSPARDYDASGKWTVRTRRSDNKDEREETFDGVLLSSGFATKPFIPDVPGLDTFKGRVQHTVSFEFGPDYEGQNVLIVGSTNSAGDVIEKLSTYCQQAYLSARSGVWLVFRMGPNFQPWDQYFQRRINFKLSSFLSERRIMKFVTHRVKPDNLGLNPQKCLQSSLPMISDGLEHAIMCGRIKMQTGVQRFTENGVVLTDGKRLDNIDTVIFGTGYKTSVDFVDNSIIPNSLSDRQLYLHMFPVHLRHPTLAAIGLIQADSSIAPIVEMQSRYAVQIFKKNLSLPTKTVMLANINEIKESEKKRFSTDDRLYLNGTLYTDEVASKLGALPSFWTLLRRSPVLAYRFIFGPAYPAFYRLTGPNQWDGAVHHISNIYDK